MSKGTVKKKPTPSAMRKRKAMQRIRKKIRVKREKAKPKWGAAISRSYTAKSWTRTGSEAAAVGEGKRMKPFQGGSGKRKRSRDEADGSDSEADDANGVEVQSEITEERMTRLNQRDPLETQLFLRHLPLDATESDVMDYFSRFGKVRRVLLVRNKVAKIPTGTAFVHCGTVEVADAIFEHAQQNARELSSMNREEFKQKTIGMSHHQAKRLEFKARTDTFLVRDPFVMLRDTKVIVSRVLSRTDSQEVVSQAKKKAKRTKVAADDPRNLYLLMEGHITPDSPAAKGLHPRYLQMIQDDFERRKLKLRNSNFFVSTVRLSLRNLPRKMSEKELRTLCLNTLRQYLKENKTNANREKWGKHGPIKNMKILPDSAGVSKGYGFVEFVNHGMALYILRELNNNPNIFGDSRRLMVSFSIEDISAVQKLARIRERRQNSLANGRPGEDEGDAYDGGR